MFDVRTVGFKITEEKKEEIETIVGQLAENFGQVGIDPESLDVFIVLSQLDKNRYGTKISIPTEMKILESEKQHDTLENSVQIVVEELMTQILSLMKYNKQPKSLYETTAGFAFGKEKDTGTAKIEQNGDLEVNITNPIINSQGTNPAQLLALSIVSCFSLHLNDIENRDHLPKTGSVKSKVRLLPDELGYKFGVTVEVTLPDLSEVKALEIIELLKLRCPTTKLFKEDSEITFELIS